MSLALRSLAERLQRRRTIYISSATKEIFFRGRSLVLLQEGEEEESVIPIEELRRFVVLGRPAFDGGVLYGLLRAAVPVDWLDRFGRPLGALTPFRSDDGAVRLAQEKFCASPAALRLARQVIGAKMDNVAGLMRRRGGLPPGWTAARRRADTARTADGLRGAEGMAARLFFGLWGAWCGNFPWQGRKAYPAPDPVNMLLSLGYGLLHNRVLSSLRHHGLDPRQGFFHVGRGCHCALASDLMEDLRYAVDCTVLRLVRAEKIRPEDFAMRGSRCILAGREAFGLVLESFERMFRRQWAYVPAGREERGRISLNDRIDEASAAFCRHVRGEADYEPFRRTAWGTAW